jgi:hypothetical protein
MVSGPSATIAPSTTITRSWLGAFTSAPVDVAGRVAVTVRDVAMHTHSTRYWLFVPCAADGVAVIGITAGQLSQVVVR